MTTIAFLGAGNIAQAIMGGLINTGGDSKHLVTCDPVPELLDRARSLGIDVAGSNDDAVSQADVIVLCVKPNVVLELLGDLSCDLAGKVFISVAAGITISQMAKELPAGTAIIRCMPNTPALVQTGMTGMFANEEVSKGQRTSAEEVMSAVGKYLWVSTEEDLDAVTAVSGSGPAYYFLLMESMIGAAISEGLSSETATELVLQTALGAARMALESDVSPAVLRQRVTSPGGTTQAALETFATANFESLVSDAIHAARMRSIELSTS